MIDLKRWNTFSLAFQLVSINVDLSRTIHQLENDHTATAQRCLNIALEYVRLTLDAVPDQLPADIREYLELFANDTTKRVTIDVAAINRMRDILEPYNMIVARERGLA